MYLGPFHFLEFSNLNFVQFTGFIQNASEKINHVTQGISNNFYKTGIESLVRRWKMEMMVTT